MKYFNLLLIGVILFSACARVGNPIGGQKDVTPPKLIFSKPSQGEVNYKGQEIVLAFDEYVTVKNPEKNLLISPPLNNLPIIKPAGIASKTIKIVFQDSLLPNTTYQINFGESIADFNEGNKLKNLKLIFSTGPIIDSLSFKGQVQTVHYDKPKQIIVGLYQAKNFKDSMVYKQKPHYVGLANEKGQFNLTNLKEGNYVVRAIDDDNGDYKYKQGEEGIGFLEQPITLPNDSLLKAPIYVFKEQQPFSIEKIEQASKNHIVINFKGPKDSLQIKMQTPVNQIIKWIQPKKADIWYQTDSDSIKLAIPVKNRLKKYARKRSDKTDSLTLSVVKKGQINPLDTIYIKGNIPLQNIIKEKILLMSDSLQVPFKLIADNHSYRLDFKKNLNASYQLTILPKAITDFLGHQNKDTVKALIKLPKAESFGRLLVNVSKKDSVPVFIELLKNNKLTRQTKTFSQDTISIPYILPAKYNLRLVFDQNQNNRWDTGIYLQHKQPEKTFDVKKPIEVRANWEVNQTIKID
jgi:hypothetical protein